jgi:hypothetical protein
VADGHDDMMANVGYSIFDGLIIIIYNYFFKMRLTVGLVTLLAMPQQAWSFAPPSLITIGVGVGVETKLSMASEDPDEGVMNRYSR